MHINVDGVKKLYDYASSPFMRLLMGFSQDIHYRLGSPLETYALLAKASGVTEGDHVLDAGCGTGGGLHWILRNTKARVTGVTLSEREVAVAMRGLGRWSDRATVIMGDMSKLPSNIGTFSVIWAIESLCHVTNKKDFYCGAFRTLLPGGRVAMLDFFLTKRFDPLKDAREYEQLQLGLQIPPLTTLSETSATLHEVGFLSFDTHDLTKNIRMSVMEREVSGWIGIILFSPLRILGLVSDMLWDNFHAGVAQGRLFRAGKLAYALFSAKKDG